MAQDFLYNPCVRAATAVLTAEDFLNLGMVQVHYMRDSADVSGLLCQGCYVVPSYVFGCELSATSHQLA
jgi:hypothetical protein